MGARKKVERPLRFRGTPVSLTGVVPDRTDPEVDVEVGYRPVGSKDEVEVAVSYDPDPRIVRLSLPARVAPGTYQGVLRLGDDERPVELEVEAAPALRVVPEQLRFEVHPGDLVGADLTLLNVGNVPVRLRTTQVFGSFMEGGVERALHQAYISSPEKEGRSRVDVLTDNLARAHPDLIRMKIREGSGDVEPGEMRELAVTLEIPADVQRGKMYRGNWEVANLVFPVTYTVLDDGKEEPEGDDGTVAVRDDDTATVEKPAKKATSKTTRKTTSKKKKS